MVSAAILAVAFGTIVASPPAAGQEAAFFSSVEDLPLMSGLRELPGEGLTYDKPEGRIVEAVASGPVSVSAVERFYAETLPQLGWTEATPRSYRRGDEDLVLRLERANGTTVVRISIAPR
jgi:hypothetical protein